MRRYVVALILAAIACALPIAAPAKKVHCTFNAASTLPFGSYDVYASADVETMGLMAITCNSHGTNFTILMSTGSHSSTFYPRYMSGNGSLLEYGIFLDAGRTTVWGDGTLGSSVYTGTAEKANSPFAIYFYGLVPAGQDVAVGTYSDSVVTTIDF
jgi:spore coat protein U-like protein